MRISNEVKNRFIELSVVESVKEHYPTYRIAISLETENIKSRFSNFIWISEEDVDAFILGLESLDRTRKGDAELRGMSPDELRIRFKAVDSMGHLSVMLHIRKEDRIAMDYCKHRVSGRPNHIALSYQRFEENEGMKASVNPY